MLNFEIKKDEMQQQINNLNEKVNDPLHEHEYVKQIFVFEYANNEETPHINQWNTNLSSEVINDESSPEALFPEKETVKTMLTGF